MNEQIRQIADKAGLHDFVLTAMGIDEEVQKFAELIVRECCDMFVELRTRPADLAVLDVKKHFGVEQ